ncbi:MAG TPA: DUF2147 domain-containing protein [Phenylobacterium sp.]|nr:DUF2147 domain-containing protein [Phenylobacterium sp.]
MRTLLLAAALALSAAPALAADPVEGEWLTQAGSAKVKIGPCAGQPERMCGALSWFRDPTDARHTDDHNPNPALKGRTMLGLPMVWGFKSAGPGRWTGGKIYDPNNGKTYDSKLTVNGDGTLKVEGCVLMICQAQTWRRS